MPQFEVINDKAFVPTLEQAQKFLQGFVEVVNLVNGDKMLVNDDMDCKEVYENRNEEATRHMIETGTNTLVGCERGGHAGYIVKTANGNYFRKFIYGNVILLPKKLKQKKW